MIKINDREYNNYTNKITWGNFYIHSSEKRTGISPFISFNIEDKIMIGLEFIYPKELWDSISPHVKIDIKKYLTDITYEDKKGWISLIIEEHGCYITKLEKNKFKINLFVESILENMKIELDVIMQF